MSNLQTDTLSCPTDQLHTTSGAKSASAANYAAPMSSAPMVYHEDGSVAWEQMWGTFCQLASAGGPPHRGEMLPAPDADDPTSPAYQSVCNELIRGIELVSGLKASPSRAGWLSVKCLNKVMGQVQCTPTPLI